MLREGGRRRERVIRGEEYVGELREVGRECLRGGVLRGVEGGRGSVLRRARREIGTE